MRTNETRAARDQNSHRASVKMKPIASKGRTRLSWMLLLAGLFLLALAADVVFRLGSELRRLGGAGRVRLRGLLRCASHVPARVKVRIERALSMSVGHTLGAARPCQLKKSRVTLSPAGLITTTENFAATGTDAFRIGGLQSVSAPRYVTKPGLGRPLVQRPSGGTHPCLRFSRCASPARAT